jgi:hypothetical protein
MASEQIVTANFYGEVGYSDNSSASFCATTDEKGNISLSGGPSPTIVFADILSIIQTQIISPLGGTLVVTPTPVGSGKTVTGYNLCFYGRVTSPTLKTVDWLRSTDKVLGSYSSDSAAVNYQEAIRLGVGNLTSLFTALSSKTVVLVSAPGQVANLVATGGQVGQISLSWTAISGATSYSVERSADGNTGWTTAGVPTTNSYTDTGLNEAATWFYRVRANNGQFGPYSSAASATTFGMSTFPGLMTDWRFDENSGNGIINRAATTPTTSFPNLIGAPEQMFALSVDQGGWEDMFGGATRTDNFAANPNNAELTASRLQLTATGNKAIRYNPGGQLVTVGQQHTISCWVKSNTGLAQTVRLFYGNGPTFSSDFTVPASGWVRITPLTFTGPAACIYVGIANGSGGAAVDVQIWGFTLHAGSADLGYTNAQADLLFPGGTCNPTWSVGRGLAFSGSSQWLMCPLGKSQTLNGSTIYVVCRRAASVTDNQRWYGALLSTAGASFTSQTLGLGVGGMISQSNWRGGPTFSYGTTNTSGDVAAAATEGVLTGTDHCICATHDGTTLRILIDGHLLAESTAYSRGAQTITRLLSGWIQSAAAGGYFKGDILRMVTYNQGHTLAQCRAGIAGLLGLSASRASFVAPPTNKIVFYEGDSLTLTAGVNPAFGWTRQCTEAALGTLGIQARNFAVSGSHSGPYPEVPADTNTVRNRIANEIATMVTPSVTRYVVAALPGFTNDATDTTAATSIANVKALGDTVRADSRGRFVCMTMPPKQNTATPNAFKAAVNASVKDPVAGIGAHCDAIADTSVDAILGLDSSATNLTYYQADAIHWTETGADRCEPYASTAVGSVL